MSYSSCISHPQGSRFIQIHAWQIQFCRENHCAALILSFFSNWHDWKIKNDQYYSKFNDIAELHGDGRPHNQNAYLFFTMEDLIQGCLGFYGKNAINEALQLLCSLEVISIHKNPNPRYHFDKTKYFQFYPSVCNQWIVKNYPAKDSYTNKSTQVLESSGASKQANRASENKQSSDEIGQPTFEIGKAITNTTSNTTENNNQSININKISEDPKQSMDGEVRLIIEKLIQQGLSTKHLKYPDTIKTMQRLYESGATVEIFLEAYSVARKVSSNGFGINYLAKVVTDILSKNSKSTNENVDANNQISKPIYTEDFSNGLDWMGDLI